MVKISKFKFKHIRERKIVLVHSNNVSNKYKWIKLIAQNKLDFEYMSLKSKSKPNEKLSILYKNQDKIRCWNNNTFGSNCYNNYAKTIFFDCDDVMNIKEYNNVLNRIGNYSRLANTTSIICCVCGNQYGNQHGKANKSISKQMNPMFFPNIDYFITDNEQDLIYMMNRIKIYNPTITFGALNCLFQISIKIIRKNKIAVINMRKMTNFKNNVNNANNANNANIKKMINYI